MFQNLIESGSHRRDLARRGRFLLGTLALYSVLVAVAGVASVSAYNARLDAQTYEVTLLPPWALPAQAHAAAHNSPPAADHTHAVARVPERTQLFSDLNTTPRTPPPISTQYNPVPPVPPGIVRIGNTNTPIGFEGDRAFGPVGGNTVAVNADTHPHVVVATPDDPTPPVVVHPTPQPMPRGPIPLSHLISSKVVSKPAPPYPSIAIAARVEGTVNVEILVDERGRVVSATAKDGPLMLRQAAQQAALLARFTPTQLNGEPVKVSGVISYNFALR